MDENDPSKKIDVPFKYHGDEMRTEFDEKMKELETDVEMRIEGFNKKQQDYAMDSMTCDEVDDKENKGMTIEVAYGNANGDDEGEDQCKQKNLKKY